MKRRKQSNRDMLERHIAERERNQETIARLTARNEELAPIILEEENVEIVAAVRARYMGLAEFERDFKGCQNGGVPFPMSETTNEQEDMQHEA